MYSKTHFIVPGHYLICLLTLDSPCTRYWRLNQSTNCFMGCQMTGGMVCQHPPCSIPTSSIWPVADHDPWPPWGMGEGREKENMSLQKSMKCNINDAGTYLHPGANELLCGLLFWELSNSTPGWLTQLHKIDIDWKWATGKELSDAETWFLCSDPEHLWRRSRADSWVILRLFAWNHEPTQLGLPEDCVATLTISGRHYKSEQNVCLISGCLVVMKIFLCRISDEFDVGHRLKVTSCYRL